MNFPSAPDRAASYQGALQARAQEKGEVIALDRLLADLAINQAATVGAGHAVKNDPPQIFFSTRPAILILVDGSPELRAVKETKLERVANTRVLILHDQEKNKYFLHLMDGWLEAANIAGPWGPSEWLPDDLPKALEEATVSKQVDLLDGSASGASTKSSLKEAARQNMLPVIYVSTVPAELLQTQGEPQVAVIEGTQLVFGTNTENDIFVYTPTQDHYILIAGRWFSSQSMNGPWHFVPADELPVDFAQIPATHPKANALVAVAGTQQAKEALIANSVPQTATIRRGAATLRLTYDGAPKFKPIENTTLEYAVNTATPVIKVDSQNYYAVQNGVWFVSTGPVGPWAVATSVPAVVYSIPLSSQLHYVTYVKIYESTPEVVYVGYTPGYYGTVVSSSNVVVYGTGWYYPPYVGTYWYGAPVHVWLRCGILLGRGCGLGVSI
ncbi:MAG TPA: hypothetical protein VJ124_11665 [Pyrinomonadaceae bacterium]|nr:hypothetical protein [Pyrinomonadaceae bacterium]